MGKVIDLYQWKRMPPKEYWVREIWYEWWEAEAEQLVLITLSIVDDDLFRSMLHSFDSRYNIPNYNKEIDDVLVQMKANIKSSIYAREVNFCGQKRPHF